MQGHYVSDAAPIGASVSEDCLFVNVWRPATGATKRPVMVWIYGGGLVNGGSSPPVYNGKAFARDGIVFVSFNYRLGRFGFFAHPALSAAKGGPIGNYALMDKIAALKWVRRNIAAFGGDANNVTVFGKSARGYSIANLLVSPQARGLFAKASLMSGPVTPPRALNHKLPGPPSAEAIGMNFARSVAIGGTGAKALAELRALPPETIVGDLSLRKLFTPSPAPEGPPTFTCSTIEDGVYVLGDPRRLIAQGKMAPVPVLVGSNGADLQFGAALSLDAAYAGFGPLSAQARRAYNPKGDRDASAVVGDIAMDRFMTEPGRFVVDTASSRGRKSFFTASTTWRKRCKANGRGLRMRPTCRISSIPFRRNGALKPRRQI